MTREALARHSGETLKSRKITHSQLTRRRRRMLIMRVGIPLTRRYGLDAVHPKPRPACKFSAGEQRSCTARSSRHQAVSLVREGRRAATFMA